MFIVDTVIQTTEMDAEKYEIKCVDVIVQFQAWFRGGGFFFFWWTILNPILVYDFYRVGTCL